jgi:hypothetical protein
MMRSKAHAPGDAEDPIIAPLEVLPDNRGHELRSLAHRRCELTVLEMSEGRMAIACERIDQLFTGGSIIPVTRGFTGGAVVIVALEHGADLALEVRLRHAQQRADGRADQRDRVLRRDGVVQRGRVQYALAADQPRLLGDLEDGFEDAVGPLGPSQPCSHVHQHRDNEPTMVVVERTSGVLPAQIEREGVSRFTIAEALDALQHHRHSHYAWRYGAAAYVAEQVGKGLVWKQAMALAREKPKDRVLR